MVRVLQGYALALLTLAACGGIQYKWYGIEMPPSCYDNGKLIGQEEEDDLPMKVCKPDSVKKNRCIVMESTEHTMATTELVQCRQKLKDCQKGPQP